MSRDQQIDLSEIRRLYRDGVNIIDHLKAKLGEKYNTDQLVETSYDMQAGSYVAYVQRHSEFEAAYQGELAQILRPLISPGDSIIDVGTGEMTTLAPVAAACYDNVSKAYAVDISLSRLIVGRDYLRDKLTPGLRERIFPVASTLFRLPFADSSLDVVWTSHALEPNGGREYDAIAELARVTRKYLVLFEPSYERNSPQGKERMDRLGYVKNLEATIRTIADLELMSVTRMGRAADDPNPTYAHLISKRSPGAPRDPQLRCPLTYGTLEPRDGYLYCRQSLLAYPVIDGIPVLRTDKGICASALDRTEEATRG
jgi:ubiquinone/menaquinone biosynthesis C-methylase UbiE